MSIPHHDTNLAVTRVSLSPPGARAARDGVLAFASIQLAGAISIQAVVLRDFRGELLIRLPTRRDRSGRRHAHVSILCPELRDRIDDAVALAVQHQAGAGATHDSDDNHSLRGDVSRATHRLPKNEEQEGSK